MHLDKAVQVELSTRLVADQALARHLVALIWIGSTSTAFDVHVDSDLDLQVVMDEPDFQAVVALGKVLRGYRNLDLSVLYLADIVDSAGRVRFQDGTKGPFFMHVLAQGEVLYGRNIYPDLLQQLTLDDLRPSLLFTIREYLQRLRVMAIVGSAASFEFKKYTLKLLKDILVLVEVLPVGDMPTTPNADIVRMAQERFDFPKIIEARFVELTDYARNFGPEDEAAVLVEVEKIVAAFLPE
jgi:hypothetical protein